MTRYIPYVLYALLLGLYEVILGDLTSIAGFKVNLLILIVAVVALHKSEIESAWAGFFLGLVGISMNPELLGWEALVVSFLAIAVFRSRQKLNMDSVWSRVAVVAGAALVFTSFQVMLESWSSLPRRLLEYVPPVVIYTSLVAWLFFLVKDGKITFKRFRRIF